MIVLTYILVTYLNMLAFLLHPASGERIALGVTCLLTIVAINFILGEILPMVPE